MAGKIIVIEGTDCSGKETQTRLLEKRLKDLGKKIFSISVLENSFIKTLLRNIEEIEK